MTKTITVRNYFGGCPTCGRNDGVYNVYKENWFVGHTHKVRWTIGSNVLSSWRDETEDEQRERWAVVAHYENIKSGSLPEGTWSRDPAIRATEQAAARAKVWEGFSTDGPDIPVNGCDEVLPF